MGACGLSALITDERVDSSRVGVVGHSDGGNVTIMLAALDERVRFACASGSACSYAQRMLDRTGIEFAHVIPGILELDRHSGSWSELIAPRPSAVALSDRGSLLGRHSGDRASGGTRLPGCGSAASPAALSRARRARPHRGALRRDRRLGYRSTEREPRTPCQLTRIARAGRAGREGGCNDVADVSLRLHVGVRAMPCTARRTPPHGPRSRSRARSSPSLHKANLPE